MKFFAMSYVPNVNGVLGKSVPRNALPLCTRNTTDIHGNPLVEEVCWEKILTDKGICLSSALSTTKVFCEVVASYTGRMGWMAHRKLKEIKQQPGTARPGNMLGCYLIIPVRHQPYPPCTVFPAHCNKLLFVTFFCQHTVFPFISGGRVARSRVSPPKQTSLILFNICYCDLHVF